MKPFKIKASKTYVSYVTASLFYVTCARKRKKKMASSQKLCNICLKTSLFEAKLSYNVLKDYFYYESQEI